MTTPGNFTSGYVVTATDMNQLPSGVENGGYAQTTTATTGVTSVTDITGLSVTFTAIAGRRYKVTVHTNVIDSGSSSVYVVRIKDGSTELNNYVGVNGHTGANTCQVFHVNNSSVSGSKTWKATLERASGAGTLSTSPSATAPHFLLVEDIGEL